MVATRIHSYLQPVAAGFALAMVVVMVQNLREEDRGIHPPLSYILVIAAAAAAAALIAGWVGQRARLMQLGLLLVFLTYVTRAAFVALSTPGDQAVFFSLAISIIAGGSWWLEVRHPRGERGGDERPA